MPRRPCVCVCCFVLGDKVGRKFFFVCCLQQILLSSLVLSRRLLFVLERALSFRGIYDIVGLHGGSAITSTRMPVAAREGVYH